MDSLALEHCISQSDAYKHLVMLLGQAEPDLICKHAEIATRFNRGEIALEDVGSAMAAVS